MRPTPHQHRVRSGFSLAELLFSLGIFTIGILALGGLSLAALKAEQKSVNVVEASQVAVKQLAERSLSASIDPSFWATDHVSTPYAQGSQKVGETEYTFECYDLTVMNSESGDTLGSGVPSNRVKKMDIVVNWYEDSASSGYGKKSLRQTCLVNESQ